MRTDLAMSGQAQPPIETTPTTAIAPVKRLGKSPKPIVTAREVNLRCPSGHLLQRRIVVVGDHLDQICPRCGESARIKVTLGEDGRTVVTYE